MFFLFGKLISMILGWVFKYWIVTIIGIAVICCYVAGCSEPPDIVSDEGSMKKSAVDDKKKQFALAAKSETDNSNTDNSQDNSINVDITSSEVPANQSIPEAIQPKLPELPDIPEVSIQQVDPQKATEIAIKVMDIKTTEREKILKAQIDAAIKQVEQNAKQREDSLLVELASVKTTKAEEMAKIVEARGAEKERVILAEAAAKEKEIRAREEKWRLMVWVIGVGAVIIAALALCIQSPLDRKKK